jgi:hypothetical protein
MLYITRKLDGDFQHEVHYQQMKIRKISLKQFHSIDCPVCHAGAGERCKLQAGGPRNAPHRDRKLLAVDAKKKASR